MWYGITIDEGIVAKADTKKEILLEINDMDTRCKRISLGVYAYEQRDESERGCWHEIAYIFKNKELACNHGFEWAFTEDTIN